MPESLHTRLASYLAQHQGYLPASVSAPVVLTGGWASSLYWFTVGLPGMRLVLKTYAPSPAGQSHAAREWRALCGLGAAGYAVPRGLLHENDLQHLGAPFIVMEYVAGQPLWDALTATEPPERAGLTQAFVGQLVALHTLAPQLLVPALAWPHAYAWIDAELAQLRRDAQGSRHVSLLAAVGWLEQGRQAVPCARPAIQHRDYHPWNVLVGAGDVLTVLDWDWQVGDSRFDIAWAMTLMQRSGFDAFRDTLRREYERQQGSPIAQLAYFEVLTTLRWLLNVTHSLDHGERDREAVRAEFRTFLAQPVQRALALLHAHTGAALSVQL